MNNHLAEIIAVYCLSVILFCVSFYYIRIVSTARKVIDIGQTAISTMADSSLDDMEKELVTKRAAMEMSKNFVMITLKGVIVTALTLIPVLAAHMAGVLPADEMIKFSSRGDTLLVTCVVVTLCVVVVKKYRLKGQEKEAQGAFSAQYSRVDRAVHRIAFGSVMLQEMLEDIESMMFRKHWADVSIRQPVFITSLPRAGTTIILEAFHHLPGFATHTYRDMPFLLSPVLWSKFSSGIRNNSTHRERAHGDGVIVSEDSPEAFEEVIWRKLCPEYYLKDGLKLWRDDACRDAGYLKAHIQKIIYLRCRGAVESARYVSKNNANIARVNAIRNAFADAFVIVPLRNPVEQAISLWRQHMNFLEQHSMDRFAKEYMGDIGHYEFGLLHRPIRFPQLENLTENLDPRKIDYWLAYWISAFDHLGNKQSVSFISYEDLCRSSQAGLSRLMEYINFNADQNDLERAASIFRPPGISRGNEYPTDRVLTTRANDLYHELKNRCILKNTS